MGVVSNNHLQYLHIIIYTRFGNTGLSKEKIVRRYARYKEATASTNRTAQPLPDLLPGDRAHIHSCKSWSEPMTVRSQTDTPRLYTFEQDTGATYIRNRRHIQRI